MKCIQFDFGKGLERATSDAFGIRIAYLFSDYFNLIGNSTFLITVEEVLKTFTLTQKVKLLYNMPTFEPDFKMIAENFLDFQKQAKSMKHPPNAVFLAGRKLENAMDAIVQEWVESFKVNLHRDGFTDLLLLADSDEGRFNIHNADHPVGKSESGHLCGLEVLNNLQPENAVRNSIWMQSDFFYHANFFETTIATSVDMIEDDMPYFIKAFEVPNLNILNITELKSIKTQMALPLAPFKTEMNEWATQCYTSGGKNHFINKVLPYFSQLQEVIDSNPILSHLANIKQGQATISAYLGEVSPLILWKFYHHHKLLSDEEYNKLVCDYDDMPNHTVPILLYMPTTRGFELGEDEKEIIEAEIPTTIEAVRKHINID